MIDRIMSQPVYELLHLDPEGRHHIVVVDGPDVPSACFASNLEREDVEIWLIAGDSTVLAGGNTNGRAVRRRFRSRAQVLSALDLRLAGARTGLRVLAAGAENFIWDVARLCRERGLGPAEVMVTHHGSRARRVYCVHCKTITEDVTTNIFTCPGCRASLLVRDHFSRRLAAYQAFQIDAEVRGEIPPVEEIYA